MATLQPNTHVFIVKIWRDDGDTTPSAATNAPIWRGRIVHVPSGTTGHFVDLDDMTAFVWAYLCQWGARPTLCWCVWRWWQRHVRH